MIDGLIYFLAVVGALAIIPFFVYLNVRVAGYAWLSAKYKFRRRYGDPSTAAWLAEDLNNYWKPDNLN